MTPLLRVFFPGALWSTSSPAIHLTFDDGPHPLSTPRILQLLKRSNVRATFFLIGSNAERYPDLVREIRAHGHLLGNHSFSHKSLFFRDSEFVNAEISRTADVLASILNERPLFFRPPYGHLTNTIIKAAKRQGHSTAMWSIDSRDFKAPLPETVVNLVQGKAKAGSIILFHDHEATHRTLGTTLSRVIDCLYNDGFAFDALPV